MKKRYQEFVFRPARTIDGKKVRSQLYVGQYLLDGMDRPKRVGLNTPDKATAEARLRTIIVNAQRRSVGLLPSLIEVSSANRGLLRHLVDYRTDMKALEFKPQHIKDSTRRIARMARESGWKVLGDITATGFTTWRAGFKGAAKTKKEYQVSLNAFLNWLVRQGKLSANPMSQITLIDTRGKGVRTPRPFTEQELSRLFAVSGSRAIVYQSLYHMGQRKNEVYQLRWRDLYLAGDKAVAHFRKETMKDKKERWVPLSEPLAKALRSLWRPEFSPDRRVFWHLFPLPETFYADLAKAGISRGDKDGEIVHFHSFRKTHASLGAEYGVSQKATQENLGHKDANLTANIYARISAEARRNELAKLPWIDTHPDAHDSVQTGHLLSFPGKPDNSDHFAKAAGAEEYSHDLAPPVTPSQNPQMVDPTGLEPVTFSMSRKRSNQLS